jgi:hypothetical protein
MRATKGAPVQTRYALAFVSIVWFALGCKDGVNNTAPPPSPMAAEQTPASAPEARPTGLAFMAPPLGAPDLIAPPTLDLIPGMRAADATAKGAKPQSNGNDWTWRPEADLKVDKDHGVIEEIVGLYTSAQIEELKQKWGKPTFGEDYWMGANWLAEIGSNCGSQPPCFVYFTRAPNQQFFGKTPVPPIGLAKLAFDMPEADVAKLFGFEPTGFTQTGYGYQVSYDFTDDAFRSVTVSSSTFIGEDQEIALVTKLWGDPAKHGDELVWVDTAARWAAVHDVGQLHYYPIAPWNDLLAKDGPFSIVGESAKLLGRKVADVGETTRDWPGTEADPTETIRLELSSDDELVTSVAFSIDLPEEVIPRSVAAIEKALGKATTSKTEDGDELSIIKTAGLAIQVDKQDWGIALTITKPAS